MQNRLSQISSLKSVDTSTGLRIEYNVNSSTRSLKNKGIKIIDLDDCEKNDESPMPDFITQVSAPVAEDYSDPDVKEQSSCFCSYICFFGCGKWKKASSNEREQLETKNESSTSSLRHDRVGLRSERKTSIVRRNTSERSLSSKQNSVLQLATISSTGDGSYIPEIEESSYEKTEEDNPWTADVREVVLLSDEDCSDCSFSGLLGPKASKFKGKKCLVLDLDETLVHSSFKPVRNPDYLVPVQMDQITYKIYVRKRPFVHEFLAECAKHYEIVIFTASLSNYANPLLDMLDTEKVISGRLFRESCVFHNRSYVKDLSKLGRRLEEIIFVDNSPLSYVFQPYNAIPITSWYDDVNDSELKDLLPVLQTKLRDIADVRELLDANKTFEWICAQAEQTNTVSII